MYNPNRKLLLWIEIQIFISITDTTDGPATCQIGIKPETGSSVQMEDLGGNVRTSSRLISRWKARERLPIRHY